MVMVTDFHLSHMKPKVQKIVRKMVREIFFEDKINNYMSKANVAPKKVAKKVVAKVAAPKKLKSSEKESTIKFSTPTQRITRTEMIAKIKNAGGKFFSVIFKTQDGNWRKMTCCLKKGNDAGNGAAVAKANKAAMGYIIVKDMFAEGEGWRTIDTRTVKELKLDGEIYGIK